ncbi:MAG: Uma2 family endonuclease [Gammaproteobacteria bacterium]|nr:Uma2 family endonuclease [Gammaproteobacteria bacterium]MDE0368256.1 Uma2 family endonuclease [Gammaproteobacteria bacterium]
MPRHLFDRLTNHDHAPRCRYDAAEGIAEFVAAPGVARESRAWIISRLFAHLEDELARRGRFPGFHVALASRLLSVDGAFEPDTSIFVDAKRAIRARQVEGYLDTDKGHPVPDLVAEVDRSVDSSHKLAPYFRMGVREAWNWSAKDGASIWIPDASLHQGFVKADESCVFPSLGRDDLDELLADCGTEEQFRLSHLLAERIAAELVTH